MIIVDSKNGVAEIQALIFIIAHCASFFLFIVAVMPAQAGTQATDSTWMLDIKKGTIHLDASLRGHDRVKKLKHCVTDPSSSQNTTGSAAFIIIPSGFTSQQ
jgi:hypothetical protein